MNYIKQIILIALANTLFSLMAFAPAAATVYFSYDAEGAVVGTELPYMKSSGAEFCQPECGSGNIKRGRIQSNDSAPQGANYFEWITVNQEHDTYNEVKNKGVFPIPVTLGKTYYVAYYFNFSRINGLDVWHTNSSMQSADKGIEIYGSGIRWEVARGQWDSFPAIGAGKFTLWLGNPSHHLNVASGVEVNDIIWPNLAGYTRTNPIKLDYERWYSCVMAIKMAKDNTGSVAVYVDGVKILERTNVITVNPAYATPNISQITMEGTIAQPAYDAPAHHRAFDALLLTDDWQDIVNRGYLSPPSAGTSPPPAPTIINIIKTP